MTVSTVHVLYEHEHFYSLCRVLIGQYSYFLVKLYSNATFFIFVTLICSQVHISVYIVITD